ncbi:MAG TPA: ABC transporter permease [Bryobacteraceae bacterium]|nr:ABC transporter permease [Bryobacteraceae bacterium]
MSDLRQSFRGLFRDPGFTLAAVALLAIGIGATTAIFTLIHSILLEPLPYPDSQRLVWMWNMPPRSGLGQTGLLGGDFQEIRDRNHSFDKIAGFVEGAWIVTGLGNAETLRGARVSTGFFDTLGVQPMLGRAFLPEEHRTGREMEVVFSYAFWRQRYGGDPNVIGRTVTLDGISYIVVGVMPQNFPFGSEHDMWAPLQVDSSYATARRNRVVRTIGRLRKEISLEQAQVEANAFAGDFAGRFPNDSGYSYRLESFLDREVGGVRQSLLIFGASVGCVLLIACSNVASLLLARGAVRVREMAVRAAVGASRGVLVRHLLIESALLSLIGGALGFPLAVLGVRLLLVLSPHALPRANEIRVDPGVLTFGLLASLATAMIFGVFPALRGSQVNLASALKDGGRSGTAGRDRQRFRLALVVVEVALGVVLMAAAGLLTRSLYSLNHLDPGYRIRNVLTMQIALTGSAYRDRNECRRFFERLLPAIEQIPGVEAAGTTNWLPLRPGKNTVGIWLDSQPVRSEETKIRLDNRVVTPGYFRAIGVPLIAGRFFQVSDRFDTPQVVVVNEAFAKELFPHGDGVGQRVTLDLGTPWIAEIVGVVGNFRESSLAEAPRRELFTPYAQTTILGQSLVVRTTGDPAGYASAVRAAVASIDKDVPIYDARTMQAQVDESLAQPRMRGVLLSVFSITALVLASLGIYGVIACAVAERRQEIGIRMALGAGQSQVRLMVVNEGLKLTAIGLLIGLVAAAATTRLLAGFLFGVTPGDPLTFLGTAAVFVLVAIAASYLPARRATRVDPLTVLRQE